MGCWRLELVGGPFDGLGGLYLWADAADELPGELRVGMCPGDRQCRMDCPGTRHPAHWVPAEHWVIPPDAIAYARRDVDAARSRAVYAVGGLEPVEVAVTGDELPMIEQESPLVPAGEVTVEHVDGEWERRVYEFLTRRRDAPPSDPSLEAFTLAWESPDCAPTIWQFAGGPSLWTVPRPTTGLAERS